MISSETIVDVGRDIELCYDSVGDEMAPPVVLIAGLGAVSICFACVALISRFGDKRELPPEEVAEIERGGYVIGGDTPPDYASPAPGREPALAPHPVSSAKA